MSVKVKVGSSWLHCASNVTFSIWSIKCSKTRPSSKIFVKWFITFVWYCLEYRIGVHQRYSQKKSIQNSLFSCQSQNSLALPVLSLRFRKQNKQNYPFSKITFSPAFVDVMTNKLKKWTEILLTTWSCYSFCSWFSSSIILLHVSGEKVQSTTKAIFPSTTDKSKEQTKRDNPMFSLMSPCIAMVEKEES